MAFITKSELGNLLQKSPARAGRKDIVQGLLNRGHEIEGFAESLSKEELGTQAQSFESKQFSGFGGGVKKIGQGFFNTLAETAGSLARAPSSLVENIQQTKESFMERQRRINDEESGITFGEVASTGLNVLSIPPRIVSSLFGSGVQAVAKNLVDAAPNPFTGEQVKRGAVDIMQDISSGLQSVYEALPERGQRALSSLAKDPAIQSEVDILFGIADIYGGAAVPKIISKQAHFVSRNVRSGFSTAAEYTKYGKNSVIKTTEVVAPYAKEVGKDVGKTALSQVSGVNVDDIEFITKSPQIFERAESGEITMGYLANKVQTGIDEQRRVVGHLGKGYEEIINRNQLYDLPDEIFESEFRSFGLSVEKGVLTRSKATKAMTNQDLAAMQEFYDLYKGTKTVSEFEYLNMRQNLDNLTKYKDGISPAANDFTARFRSRIDRQVGTQIPELKELDARYAPERAFLKELEKEFLSRKYNPETGLSEVIIDDTALARIYSALGRTKDRRLSRLKAIAPGIDDEIRAYRTLVSVEASKGIKVGTYARGVLYGAAGFAAGGPIGFLGSTALILATHPTVVIPILKAYGRAKGINMNFLRGILNKFSKGDELVLTERRFVEEAIQANDKLLDARKAAKAATNAVSPESSQLSGLPRAVQEKTSPPTLPEQLPDVNTPNTSTMMFDDGKLTSKQSSLIPEPPDVNQLESPKGLPLDGAQAKFPNLTPEEVARMTPEERATGIVGGGDGMPRTGGSEGVRLDASGLDKSLPNYGTLKAQQNLDNFIANKESYVKRLAANGRKLGMDKESSIAGANKVYEGNVYKLEQTVNRGGRSLTEMQAEHDLLRANKQPRSPQNPDGEIWGSRTPADPDALSKADVDVPSAKGTAAKVPKELEALAVEARKVLTKDNVQYIDPKNYSDFDGFIRDIEQLNADRTSKFYIGKPPANAVGEITPLDQIKVAKELWGNRPKKSVKEIPISEISLVEKPLAKKPVAGRKIESAIDVYAKDGKFNLLDGRHRLDQAIANGDKTIKANVSGESMLNQANQ